MATVTVTPQPLVEGVLLAAAVTTLYTSPALTTTTIRSYTICNNDSVDRTVRVHLVASGDSPSDSNRILKDALIHPDETLIDDTLRNLAPGDYIAASADSEGIVSFRADGAQIK